MLPTRLRKLIAKVEKNRFGWNLLEPLRAPYELILWQSSCRKTSEYLKKHFGQEVFRLPPIPYTKISQIKVPQISKLFNMNPATFYPKGTNSLRSIYRVSSFAFLPLANHRGKIHFEKTSGSFLGTSWDTTLVYNHLSAVSHSDPENATVWHQFSPQNNLEDPRHFQDENDDWLLCSKVTTKDVGDNRVVHHSISAIRISDRYQVNFPSPFGQNTEKNWVPIYARNGVLKVLYSNNPLRILDLNLKNGGMNIAYETTSNFFPSHGGSPLIPLGPDFFIRISRIKFPYKSLGFVNLQILSIHDKTFKEVLSSRPFFFEKLGLEVCNSLIIDWPQDKVLFSWGRDDRSLMVAEVSIKNLFTWLIEKENICRIENETVMYFLEKLIHEGVPQ